MLGQPSKPITLSLHRKAAPWPSRWNSDNPAFSDSVSAGAAPGLGWVRLLLINARVLPGLPTILNQVPRTVCDRATLVA